jgi:hypothetical protein
MTLTLDETKSILLNSYSEFNSAYWNTNDQDLKNLFTEIERNIQSVLDQLIYEQVETNTAAFEKVKNEFNLSVLKPVQQLQTDIQSEIDKYLPIKSLLYTLGQIESATAFFKIPTI